MKRRRWLLGLLLLLGGVAVHGQDASVDLAGWQTGSFAAREKKLVAFAWATPSPLQLRDHMADLERAAHFTRLLPSTTRRYFYWGDDGKTWCRCSRCRHLSDSDQALVVEHEILRAVRGVDPRGTLAHVVYHKTLQPPTQVKPEPGIFLEFAPIERPYDRPLLDRAARRLPTDMTHGEHLDCLDANLEVFGTEGAQVLEYWMDNARFSGWQRDQVGLLPWNREVFLDDIALYASRGIRHITQFATWLDGWYVEHFGEPPVDEYGAGLLDVLHSA